MDIKRIVNFFFEMATLRRLTRAHRHQKIRESNPFEWFYQLAEDKTGRKLEE